MYRIIFSLLLLVSLDASAAVRRLATDCTLPSYTPTESQPFELDSCSIGDGDDITQLLTDIRSKWPAGFFVRAPSKTVNVISDTINWPTDTKMYVFLEDQDSENKMLIQHAANPADFWTMWLFSNFDTVKIGGPNLSLTFKGNHPGLANCDKWPSPWPGTNCDANKGLIEFRMTDGSVARLADIRANTKFSQHYGIYTWGSTGGTTNIINDLNVAGLHYATSGVFFHQGVKNAWADPDKTVVSDPYVRVWGWDGTATGTSEGGLPMGCHNPAAAQLRGTSFTGYYTQSITGGVTLEYGAANWVERLTGRIGNGVNDPFIVKVKDWHVTGTGTGYPAGVRVKKLGQAMIFKGDPHDAFPDGNNPTRFVRYEKLPSDYGDGPASQPNSGCAISGPGKNTFMDGPANLIILENDTTGLNRGWHVTIAGDWDKPNCGSCKFRRGNLFRFAGEGDTARIYLNTLNAAAGTTIRDTIVMNDTDTVTGPGTFTNVQVSNYNGVTPGRDNTIVDTNISGKVTVEAGTETTTIRDVYFVGAARPIISIGSGSSAVVSEICAPSGCTITGAGSLVYNGVSVALPFTIDDANACNAPTNLSAPTNLRAM